MENDKDMKKLYAEASSIERQLAAMRGIDTEAAYANVQRVLRRNRRRKLVAAWFNRAAAILLLPLLLSTFSLLYMYIHRVPTAAPTAMVEIVSPTGAIARVMLPDSSVVWLNSGSRLSYPQRFTGDARSVSLTGEGFFSVSSDREHPFYVSLADGLRVMAHGTRFNISSYADAADVEMTLERGAIDILQGGRCLSQLKPNEQVVYNRRSGAWIHRRVDVEEYGSWKDNRLVFHDMPLGKVFEQIGRRCNATIVIHDSSLEQCKIRATFSHQDISQILDDIRLVAPIRWTMTGNGGDGTRKRIDIYKTYK